MRERLIRPRRGRTGAAALLAVVGLAGLGVGCSGSPEPTVAPDTAGSQVAALLLLDGEAETCLQDGMVADPPVAAVLNGSEALPDGASRARFLELVRSCAPTDVLAGGLAGLVVTASSQPDATTCATEAVIGLEEADRDLLVLQAVNPALTDNAQRLRLATLAGDLADRCGVAVPTLPDDGGTGVDPGAGPPTVSLDDGAVTQTR